MDGIRNIVGAISLFALGLLLALIPQSASSGSASGATQAGNNEPVPAFHSDAPSAPLPATMDPALFDKPVVRNAYSVAAGIKKILYQQPCYCRCDRSHGHGSLLDCFVSNHTAGCGVCMQEVFYVYEQLHKDKTAAQIREGIEQGEWKQVDLKRYEAPLPAKQLP